MSLLTTLPSRSGLAYSWGIGKLLSKFGSELGNATQIGLIRPALVGRHPAISVELAPGVDIPNTRRRVKFQPTCHKCSHWPPAQSVTPRQFESVPLSSWSDPVSDTSEGSGVPHHRQLRHARDQAPQPSRHIGYSTPPMLLPRDAFYAPGIRCAIRPPIQLWAGRHGSLQPGLVAFGWSASGVLVGGR